MTSVRIVARILPTILVCLWVSTAPAQQSTTLSKVAILPFTMNAPNDLAYVKDNIRDMLTSRLAWQGKVQVIDRASVDQAMRSRKTGLTPEEAVSIGKGLKADYVLFGTVTAIGKAMSIDAKMVPIKADAEPVDLYSQANSLDEVIPKINQFAELVNRKVFGRSTDMAQSSTEIDTSATMNPELLIPQMMMPGGKISYLNPNFLEVTPEGALRQPGLWRSQTFNWGILGMDVGDLDGDGQQELVTVSHNNIIVYKRIEGALKAVANHQGDKLDRFTWVVVVDANRDGRGEIFVTNLRRFSQPEKQTDKGGLYEAESVELHSRLHGKVEVKSKVALADRRDLSLAYTPGVAQVCLEIAKDPHRVFELTIKRNTEAVISDGSAILGTGSLGAAPAIPVMEGKAVLFKEFANVDAFPICLDTQDSDEIVDIVRAIAPVFGGINLKDIAAPRCFEIEERLQNIGIPVFHDDQHGTAIVVVAALLNALKVSGKDLAQCRIVFSGTCSPAP